MPVDRFGEFYCLAGRVVGQAEDDEVDGAHDVAARVGVAALGMIDRAHGEGERLEALGDAEAGGAGLAVDEKGAAQRRARLSAC